MKHFIKEMRKEFRVTELPFVIGVILPDGEGFWGNDIGIGEAGSSRLSILVGDVIFGSKLPIRSG